MMQTLFCAALALFTFSEAAPGFNPRLRGVHTDPNRAAPYKQAVEGGALFQCPGSSVSVPADRLNDDYCDCPEAKVASSGSGAAGVERFDLDEPGTSACALRGRFHCKNELSKPLDIPSTRVNDGVCDCCDGTDEYQLEVTGKSCPNTCDEQGAELRQQAADNARIAREGFQIRLQYAQEGQEMTAQWKEQIGALDKQLPQLEANMNSAEDSKKGPEAEESAAKDAFDKEWESRVSNAEDEAKQEAFALLVGNDEKITWQHLLARQDLKEGAEAGDDDVVDQKELGSALDIDEDSDLAKLLGPVSEENNVVNVEGLGLPSFTEFLWPKIKEKLQNPKRDNSAPFFVADDKPEYTETIVQLESKAKALRDVYTAAKDAFDSNQNEKKRLEKLQELDFGPDMSFYSLHGKDLEFTDREYVYKIQMYGSASQEPKNGGRSTSLGSWTKFSGEGNLGRHKYTRANFENGEKCWNGPSRSITISLVCGVENELSNVEEPNRCEYSATLATPAVCEKPGEGHDEL